MSNKEYLLTIGILHYELYDQLSLTIREIEKLLLQSPLIEKIEILVSDNNSSNQDKLKTILDNSQLPIRLIHTKEYGNVDTNILNIYNNSRGEYVNIWASDDGLSSLDHLKYLLKVFQKGKYDIVAGVSGLKPEIWSDDVDEIDCLSIYDRFELIRKSSKSSLCFIRTSFSSEVMTKFLKNYIGYGYLHVSIMSFIASKKSTQILETNKVYTYTRHDPKKWRHEYHPKFAQTLDKAMRIDYFYKNIPRFKYRINNENFVQLYWLARSITGRTLFQWDEEMLQDYINQIFFDVRYKMYNPLYIILPGLVLILLFLSLDFKNFISSLMGIIGFRKPITYEYVHGNKKSPDEK